MNEGHQTSHSLPHEVCRYYLARTTMPGAGIEIVDGCHDSPEGVVEAARLHERIFHAEGPWTMIEATPLPEIAVAINEDDAELCRALVDGEL